MGRVRLISPIPIARPFSPTLLASRGSAFRISHHGACALCRITSCCPDLVESPQTPQGAVGSDVVALPQHRSQSNAGLCRTGKSPPPGTRSAIRNPHSAFLITVASPPRNPYRRPGRPQNRPDYLLLPGKPPAKHRGGGLLRETYPDAVYRAVPARS
jgi:hypothetical protein